MGIWDYLTNYSPNNSAIDILVIEQSDGTLCGSPFHIQFGFRSVLRPSDRVVYIDVNEERVDVTMKLGRSGEAYFYDPDDEIVSPTDTPKKDCPKKRRRKSVSESLVDPASALSDSELEVERSKSDFQKIQGYLSDPELTEQEPQTTSHVTLWKWGQLPETSSNTTIQSDITSDDSFKSASSISEVTHDAGSSTIAPKDDEELFGLDRGMKLSLCGGHENQVSHDLFDKHVVSWETFSKDPKSIIENPMLVIKDGERYLNWASCAAMAVSRIFFDKELPEPTLEKLKTPTRKPWFFGFGKSGTSKASSAETINNNEATPSVSTFDRFKGKTLTLDNDDLQKLKLKAGRNKIEFMVITKIQGTAIAEANIYLWNYRDKIIVSDIDGTVTKSNVVGHISNVFYIDYTHKGIHDLYGNIERNGYKFVYVSSRGISQSSMTKTYINWTKQSGRNLPYGPVLLNPASLISALLREVWTRNPEEFKIDCLSGVKCLFPGSLPTPFYAGFGNKSNDETAYRQVDIPEKRIFTISKKGIVKSADPSLDTFSTSYEELADIVDHFFPHRSMNASTSSLQHLENRYWRTELPEVDFDLELNSTSS